MNHLKQMNMKKTAVYLTLLLAVAASCYWVYQYKHIEKKVFAGLSLGVPFNQYRQQLRNSNFERTRDGTTYYMFREQYGLHEKVFYGVPCAYYNQDSIVTKIVVTLLQIESAIPTVYENARHPNNLVLDLSEADQEDHIPSPEQMASYLREYYKKEGYKFQTTQIPIHIADDHYTEYSEVSSIYGSHEPINITISSIYLDHFKDPFAPIAHLSLTFEFTDYFIEHHGLQNKIPDNPF